MRKDAKAQQRALEDVKAAQVEVLRGRLTTSPDDDTPLAQARRMMSAALPDLLETPKPKPETHRQSAAVLTTAFGIGSAALLGAGYIAWNAADQAAPTNTPDPQVTIFMQSFPEAQPAVVVQISAEPSPTPSITPSAKPAKSADNGTSGTSGGTSSGGTSTGTSGSSSGGGGSKPKPTTTTKPKPEPPAAYADSMSWTGTSGAGFIDISANVHTTGAFSVTVTAQGPNGTVTLGSKTIDGWGTFSGRLSGLEPGTYTITVSAGGGLTTSKQVPVF